MSKININNIMYDELGAVKIGNREYVFGLSDNSLDYFERVTTEDGVKYITLNSDLTLEGNAGTSLMKLNERIVMSHVADNMKRDIKLGKLNSHKDIANEIECVQAVIAEEPNIKKILKGNPTELDEEKFAKSAKDLVSYFDSKIKDKKRHSNDFDIIEGGVDKTFSSNSLYDELRKEKEQKKIIEPLDEVDEELSPTIILDRLEDVSTRKLQAEIKKENPSTEIIGVSSENLSTDLIERVLTKKQDQITPIQTAYLEHILETKEEKVEPKIEEKPITPVKEEVIDDDATFVFTKKEEVKEEKSIISPSITNISTPEDDDRTLIFAQNKNNIPGIEEEFKEKEEYEAPAKVKKLSKGPKSKKAAYVDTVILCLLTQLGIFSLIIFTLLVIK